MMLLVKPKCVDLETANAIGNLLCIDDRGDEILPRCSIITYTALLLLLDTGSLDFVRCPEL
jgi:hypothetical protein